MRGTVDVVLPCLNEADAIAGVLQRFPGDYRALVVDNGSTDASARLAAGHGAVVITESRRGYGAAVAAGLAHARAEHVAVMDLDGSVDPADLAPLVLAVQSGRCDLAVGRRRPVDRRAWPWHARLGNVFLAKILARRIGVAISDLAPVRVGRRADLVALDIQDRRSGYPVETLVRAARAGWRIQEFDLPYHRRAAGTHSKVTGSLRGTITALHDMTAVLRRTSSRIDR